VRLPEFWRTTIFRWTLAASGAFAVTIVLMLLNVYWRTNAYVTASTDQIINAVAGVIEHQDPAEAVRRLEDHLASDPRLVKLGGLFDRDGKRLAGNIDQLPAGLPLDGSPHIVSVTRSDASHRQELTIRAVARQLGTGAVLVVGRNPQESTYVWRILEETLVLSVIPALCLGFGVGAFLSFRAQRRVDEVNKRIQRIVAGDLRERLPAPATDDPFDRLSSLVNGMLDDIEALMRRISGVGDDIAHDLRTPLTRVRVVLERARQNTHRLEDLQAAVDQAIAGLDQSLAIVTALLRIAEIEHSRRLAGFGKVDLAELVREVGEFYEPIAEDKKIEFAVSTSADAAVSGDRDLLFEAIGNLADNALKFTPEGGRVELSLLTAGEQAVVRVTDSGPGIPVGEGDLVGRRFYRSDKSRSHPGLGLGLSLVTAIVKLHGFQLVMSSGPGCVAEIIGRRA
jgi:signal transduction histidine kinase